MADTKNDSAPKEEKRQFSVAVITEVHQMQCRRVALPEAACCQAFEEEYGKEFMLTKDGGMAPASLRIERIKLGKIVYDWPKFGWTACPFCGTGFAVDHQEVVKTSPAAE